MNLSVYKKGNFNNPGAICLSRRSLLRGVWGTAKEPYLLAVKHHRFCCYLSIVRSTGFTSEWFASFPRVVFHWIRKPWLRILCGVKLRKNLRANCVLHCVPLLHAVSTSCHKAWSLFVTLKSCGRSVPAMRVLGSHPKGSFKQHGAVHTYVPYSWFVCCCLTHRTYYFFIYL